MKLTLVNIGLVKCRMKLGSRFARVMILLTSKFRWASVRTLCGATALVVRPIEACRRLCCVDVVRLLLIGSWHLMFWSLVRMKRDLLLDSCLNCRLCTAR